MSQKLTQEEIDKLLNQDDSTALLTEEEIDMLGEIGNIGMGNSATALSQILNRKVNITTPKVKVLDGHQLPNEYAIPFVTVEITYIEGLEGKNVLNLKVDDVKIITDIMMGGPGVIKEGPIDEMHLSAAGELMNQMMGSSSTALAEMMDMRLNISTPTVTVRDYSSENLDFLTYDSPLVMTVFDLTVENTIKSEIMLVMSIDFAQLMIEKMKKQYAPAPTVPQAAQSVQSEQIRQPAPQVPPPPQPAPAYTQPAQTINVQKVELQTFGEQKRPNGLFGNRYDILMDVPLEVTIEIGRVRKPISEILSFSSGTIIELDKLVGEDLNIVINDKVIGKGEVVVIDEHYGMRISEILDKNEM